MSNPLQPHQKQMKVEPIEAQSMMIPQKRVAHVADDIYFTQTSRSIGIALQPDQKPMKTEPMMMIPHNRAAHMADDMYFTKNYSGVAAAAAAKVEDDNKDDVKPMMIIPQKRAAPVVDGSYFTPKREPMEIPFLHNQKPMGAQKQALPSVVDDSYFRKNYSAVAAAASKKEDEEEEEDEDKEEEEDKDEDKEEEEDEDEEEEEDEDKEEEEVEEAFDGIKKLAKAIKRFSKMYQKIETEKLRQMLELQNQRMQFAKDMEAQRMQWMQIFMDNQLQLEKIKRAKQSGSDGSSS